MTTPRKITSLLCPKCLAPDNKFIVRSDGKEIRPRIVPLDYKGPTASEVTVVVDDFGCRPGEKEPEPIPPDAMCVCLHCNHQGKARTFAVKHTRQPGEKFAKDELEFLNEPCKGMVQSNRKKRK